MKRTRHPSDTGFFMFWLTLITAAVFFLGGVVAGKTAVESKYKMLEFEYAKHDSLVAEVDVYSDSLNMQVDRIRNAYSKDVAGWYLYPMNQYNQVIGMPIYVARQD
jgi:hypothetical protein